MITFSFNPSISSLLPWMAAELNTLVVSWNDAAEIQLCVPSEALVIPSSEGADVAGCASRNSTSFFIVPAQDGVFLPHFTQANDLACTQFA